MKLESFDRIVVMSVDTRYPDFPTRTVQLLRDHGANDPQIFLNGRGVPRLDLSWYDLVHDGEPPEGYTSPRGQWDYGNAYRAVIERALADGVERLLVTEDDLDFSPDFAAVVARARIPGDWQIFSYGMMHQWASEPAAEVAPYVRRLNGGQLGTQSVAWRPEAMRRYLEKENDRPVDCVVAGLHNDFPSYCLHRAVIRQAVGVESAIVPGEPFSADFIYEIK